MIDTTKHEQLHIWFERALAKQVRKAAKSNDTDAAKWIRQACREKLEREQAQPQREEQAK